MSAVGVVEVSLKFLGDMLGEEVFCAEVDNLAGTVNLLVRSDRNQEDPPGVRPVTVRRCHDIHGAFDVLRYPGQPLAFVRKARQP